MDTIVEFLRARLDEDEQIARAAEPGPWLAVDGPDGGVGFGPEDFAIAYDYTGKHRASHAHVANWGPDRVLRETAAKREVVNLVDSKCGADGGYVDGWEDAGLWAVKALAMPYAG